MGLFGALNKMSGYSAENMNKVFDEFLPVMDSKAICPIGISLKAKGLFSSKPIASGFATITNTSHLQNMALGAKMQMEMQSIPTG